MRIELVFVGFVIASLAVPGQCEQSSHGLMQGGDFLLLCSFGGRERNSQEVDFSFTIQPSKNQVIGHDGMTPQGLAKITETNIDFKTKEGMFVTINRMTGSAQVSDLTGHLSGSCVSPKNRKF